jgi:hypothetical protein
VPVKGRYSSRRPVVFHSRPLLERPQTYTSRHCLQNRPGWLSNQIVGRALPTVSPSIARAVSDHCGNGCFVARITHHCREQIALFRSRLEDGFHIPNKSDDIHLENCSQIYYQRCINNQSWLCAAPSIPFPLLVPNEQMFVNWATLSFVSTKLQLCEDTSSRFLGNLKCATTLHLQTKNFF